MKARLVVLGAVIASSCALAVSANAGPVTWHIECTPSPSIFPVTTSDPAVLQAAMRTCADSHGRPTVTVVR